MKNPIERVEAVDGKIEMILRDGTVLPLTDDPKMIALAIGCYGNQAYFGSSMDHADECDFESSWDAKILWGKAVIIYENVARGEF
jgi:hypothetical protein